MKGFEEILPLIVALLVAALLFLGFITVVKKALKTDPPKSTIDSSSQLREQKKRAEDIQRRQKQLMEDQRQRIRDMQRR